MQTVTCPKCGKELKVRNPDREFMFCEYCGEKIEIAPFVRDAAKSEKSKFSQKAPHHTAADVAYRFVDAFASPFEEYRREKEEAKRKLEEEQRRQEEEARMAEEQARIRREERARRWNDNQKKSLHFAMPIQKRPFWCLPCVPFSSSPELLLLQMENPIVGSKLHIAQNLLV